MRRIGGFAVSNKAFTYQMIGQQLISQLGQHLGYSLSGFYKYHKISLFSVDPHLNHHIFIRKCELIEFLQQSMKDKFGIELIIKDIVFLAKTEIRGEYDMG